MTEWVPADDVLVPRVLGGGEQRLSARGFSLGLPQLRELAKERFGEGSVPHAPIVTAF
jgi:hypothetical protein